MSTIVSLKCQLSIKKTSRSRPKLFIPQLTSSDVFAERTVIRNYEILKPNLSKGDFRTPPIQPQENLQQSIISRPRNKFIIARHLIGTYLSSKYPNASTAGVSKIVSIVCIAEGSFNLMYHTNTLWVWKNQDQTKNYFGYLAIIEDIWHESYHPIYHFSPKVKKKSEFETTESFPGLKFPQNEAQLTSDIKFFQYKGISDYSGYSKICESSYSKVSKIAKKKPRKVCLVEKINFLVEGVGSSKATRRKQTLSVDQVIENSSKSNILKPIENSLHNQLFYLKEMFQLEQVHENICSSLQSYDNAI